MTQTRRRHRFAKKKRTVDEDEMGDDRSDADASMSYVSFNGVRYTFSSGIHTQTLILLAKLNLCLCIRFR